MCDVCLVDDVTSVYILCDVWSMCTVWQVLGEERTGSVGIVCV